MAANQFGIDVGQIIGTRNALMDQQQRQQINALALQRGQREEDYQNALVTAPDEQSRLSVMQKFDPEKALQYAGTLSAQQRKKHDDDVEAMTDTLGALDTVPDAQLAVAAGSARAKLQSEGVPTAALDQALQQSGSDPKTLRAALKQQAESGLHYKDLLANREKTREFDVRQSETASRDKATQAQREFTNTLATENLALSKERVKQGQEKIDQANAPSDPATISSYGDNILNGNATLQNVPQKDRPAVSRYLTEQTDATTPLGAQRSTLASSRITKPFTELPQYQLTAGGLPYLQRIDAASKHPGAIGDAEMLDSLVKLNTAGNAVTEAQVSLITKYGSLSDMFSRLANRVKNGGALSDSQRKDLQAVAKATFENYKKGYQPVYDQATTQLKQAGIKPQFWTIPDLNKLSEKALPSEGGTIPDAARAKLQEGTITTFGNGQKWTLQNGQPVQVTQ